MTQKRNAAGRPLKYTSCFELLEDEVLYSPAMIAKKALELGNYGDLQVEKKTRIMIRHTFAKLAKNHKFPKDGDGLVQLSGQAMCVAFYGKRWKAVLKKKADLKTAMAQVQSSEAA